MDFVYANNDGRVLFTPAGAVDMRPGDVWYADDPFVQARPDLFSATPVVVRSTIGRSAPDPAPVGELKRRGRARG